MGAWQFVAQCFRRQLGLQVRILLSHFFLTAFPPHLSFLLLPLPSLLSPPLSFSGHKACPCPGSTSMSRRSSSSLPTSSHTNHLTPLPHIYKAHFSAVTVTHAHALECVATAAWPLQSLYIVLNRLFYEMGVLILTFYSD